MTQATPTLTNNQEKFNGLFSAWIASELNAVGEHPRHIMNTAEHVRSFLHRALTDDHPYTDYKVKVNWAESTAHAPVLQDHLKVELIASNITHVIRIWGFRTPTVAKLTAITGDLIPGGIVTD